MYMYNICIHIIHMGGNMLEVYVVFKSQLSRFEVLESSEVNFLVPLLLQPLSSLPLPPPV